MGHPPLLSSLHPGVSTSNVPLSRNPKSSEVSGIWTETRGHGVDPFRHGIRSPAPEGTNGRPDTGAYVNEG